MKAHPTTTEYNRLKSWVNAAGYSMDQFAEVIGQGAYDVDDFQDTYLCGAVTGDCVYAPVFNAGASLVNYTSYWHSRTIPVALMFTATTWVVITTTCSPFGAISITSRRPGWWVTTWTMVTGA